jgi:hypothetical protein
MGSVGLENLNRPCISQPGDIDYEEFSTWWCAFSPHFFAIFQPLFRSFPTAISKRFHSGVNSVHFNSFYSVHLRQLWFLFKRKKPGNLFEHAAGCKAARLSRALSEPARTALAVLKTVLEAAVAAV